MEMELLAERFQNIRPVNAPYVYPGDRVIRRWREPIERQILTFVAASAAVVEDLDRDFVGFFLADMNEGTRGEPCLSGSFLDQLH